VSVKTGKRQGGRFAPGQSGNPAGRPRGARNKATLAVMELLDGEAVGLTRKAVELALAGDTTALRLCLERLCPAPKDAPLAVDALKLPTLCPGNMAQANAAVVRAVARGALTPAEGRALQDMLESYRRAVELTDMEKRLAALEAMQEELRR